MHAVAAISQSALAHNLSIVRKYAPQAKIVSMVKANAYGHHLELAKPLFTADILAVSELSEVKITQVNPKTNFAFIRGF